MIRRRIDSDWDKAEGIKLSLISADTVADIAAIRGTVSYDFMRTCAFMGDEHIHFVYAVDEKDITRLSNSSDFVVQFTRLLRTGSFTAGSSWYIRPPTPYDLLVSTEVGLVTAQQVLLEIAALGYGNYMRVVREVGRGLAEVLGAEPAILVKAEGEGKRLGLSDALKLVERLLKEFKLPL